MIWIAELVIIASNVTDAWFELDSSYMLILSPTIQIYHSIKSDYSHHFFYWAMIFWKHTIINYQTTCYQ